MNHVSDRNGLEVTETISVAGSAIGAIWAIASNQLIYAAAPLTLALSLSTINRRRFEQNFQQNMLSFLSEVNSRITETDQKIAGELNAVKDAAKSLPPAPEPVNIKPLQQEISALQKRFDTLEVAIGNISSKANAISQPAFDPTYIEQQIQELKTVIANTEKTPVPSINPEQLNQVKQEIQQLQGSVSSLKETFNQRLEPSQIAALEQNTAAIAQKIADSSLKPQIQQLQAEFAALKQEFHQQLGSNQMAETTQNTVLKQQIQQLQGELSWLKEAFNQRLEPSQIAEIKQTTAAIDQKIADSSLEQQVQQLQGELSALNKAFNQRLEPSQIVELKQTTAAIDQKIADSFLEQQIQQLKSELSALKQEFYQRPEPSQIRATQQQIFALEPVSPAFDPAPLEQQIQQLKLAIAQIDSAQTNFTIQFAKLPQLWENVAQLQQQQSDLQQLIVQIQQPPSSPVFPLVTFGGKIQPHRTKNNRIQAIMEMAQAHGIGPEFQLVTQAAEKLNLTLNPWPTDLAFTPAHNLIAVKTSKRSQCLFTMSGQPTPEGKVRLWLSSQAFADFYPVMRMTVTSILGFDGWVAMTKPEIEQFVASLNRLFESLEANPANLY